MPHFIVHLKKKKSSSLKLRPRSKICTRISPGTHTQARGFGAQSPAFPLRGFAEVPTRRCDRASARRRCGRPSAEKEQCLGLAGIGLSYPVATASRSQAFVYALCTTWLSLSQRNRQPKLESTFLQRVSRLMFLNIFAARNPYPALLLPYKLFSHESTSL